ncbi:MAG: hypothetical protein QNK16_11110 [Woeseiaceae bacterium]|nr:hypothetical protein [Woeseiaceae bacterium]MDX2608924.1 hypothetical protein [Woeseiaceae bacterium]
MELDDLKPAWQRMERELQAQRRITSTLLAERASSRVEASLKPLFNWQVFQIIVGIGLAGLAAQFWLPRMDQTLLLVSGIIVHAYGVALIINGINVVLRLREIDYGAPVTTLQKHVARLERSYVLSGWILGLPWWLLWIPMALMFLSLAGVDLSRVSPENWLPANIVFGTIGMFLTVVGFYWARHSSRPGVRARLERMVSVASIDKAKRLLTDIERFEQDVD